MLERHVQPIIFNSPSDVTAFLDKLELILKQEGEHRHLTDHEVIQLFTKNLIYNTFGTYLASDLKEKPSEAVYDRDLAYCLYQIYINRHSTYPFHFPIPRGSNGHRLALPQMNIDGLSYEMRPDIVFPRPNVALQSLIALRFNEDDNDLYRKDQLIEEINEREEVLQKILTNTEATAKQLELNKRMLEATYKRFAEYHNKDDASLNTIDAECNRQITSLKKRQTAATIASIIMGSLATIIIFSAIVAAAVLFKIPVLLYVVVAVSAPASVLSLVTIVPKLAGWVYDKFEQRILTQASIQENIKSFTESRNEIQVIDKKLQKKHLDVQTVTDQLGILRNRRVSLLQEKKKSVKLANSPMILLAEKPNAKQELPVELIETSPILTPGSKRGS